jgi:hypothetical protein
MVMLKVLQQYYSATGDKRVIALMTSIVSFGTYLSAVSQQLSLQITRSNPESPLLASFD